MRRGSRWVSPQFAASANRAWVSAKRADSAATMRSAASASSSPPVTQYPWTEAITGCGRLASRSITEAWKCGRGDRVGPEMSAPAEKHGPAPRTTTTPISSTWASRSARWASSATNVAISRALRLLGRLRVSKATESRSSRRTGSGAGPGAGAVELVITGPSAVRWRRLVVSAIGSISLLFYCDLVALLSLEGRSDDVHGFNPRHLNCRRSGGQHRRLADGRPDAAVLVLRPRRDLARTRTRAQGRREGEHFLPAHRDGTDP